MFDAGKTRMIGLPDGGSTGQTSLSLKELDVERELMAKVVKLKLQYFGHVVRGSAGQLALTVLEGSMEGTRYQGKPRRRWLNDTEDWTVYKYIQLKEMSVGREQWRKKTRDGQLLLPTLRGGRPTTEREMVKKL